MTEKIEPIDDAVGEEPEIRVRRLHRRDINRTWEFLKLCFRNVNRETVEYQRPLSRRQFSETYEEEGVEQLLFEIDGEIVGYAECAYTASDSENWLNPRYFDKRGMRPLFVEEIAVHPKLHSRGIGNYMLEQLQHLGRARGLTHIVLEVAQNNKNALEWYRRRKFYKLDAAIFMAQRLNVEPELLPPRKLKLPADTPKVGELLAQSPRKAKAKKSVKKRRPSANGKS